MTSDDIKVIYYDFIEEYVNYEMMIHAIDIVGFWRCEKFRSVKNLLENELDDISKGYMQSIVKVVMERTLSFPEFVTYLVRYDLLLETLTEYNDKQDVDPLDIVAIRKKRQNEYEEFFTEHLLMKLFYYMCDLHNIDPSVIIINLSSNDTLQKIFDNSYDAAMAKIIQNLQEIYIPLSAQGKIDIDKIKEEILLNKSMLNDVFLNPKKSSKIKSGHHFLSKLMKDSVTYSGDGRIYFTSLFRGIVDGYTEKAIKLSVDTQKALKELERDREVFVKHQDMEKIKFVDSLIQFLETNKNANYIPFKIIATTLGMSKNEARNFAKYIINLNENSFNREFEQYARFPSEYNTVVKDNKNI